MSEHTPDHSGEATCSIVDVFCGVGGLTQGFVLEGLPVAAGIDSDGSCRYAYEWNNGAQFVHAPIESLTPSDLAVLFPPARLKVLIGCAPCQPYSKYARTRKSQDDKWQLLSSFADVIDAVQPDIVSMENVPDLTRFRHGAVYDAFVRRLEPTYTVTSFIVNGVDYGLPQERRRLVLFASRRGAIDLLAATHDPGHRLTVHDAIHSLPPLEAGGCSSTDPLHRASALSDLNLRRIRQSRPGGTWRDWDADLVAACHTRPTGATYPSVYGRMAWDAPAPTMTTQCYGYGTGRFGHPEQDRAISLREAALLQTFPPEYVFTAPGEPIAMKTVARHIGNAVPVTLGRVIAKSIKAHIARRWQVTE